MPNNNNNWAQYSGAVLVSMLLASSMAQATELGSEFRVGYMKTDNIFLAPSDGTESSIGTFGMTFSLKEETVRTQAEIRMIADYLDYEDYFDSEWIAALDANASFAIVPERFYWVIQDNFGRQLLDPLSTPNPGNHENINYFSTGPMVQIPMGPRYFMELQGKLSSVAYSESNYGDHRGSGKIRLGQRANEDTTYSISVSSERVKFTENDIGNDFDISEAFLNYALDSDRTQANIDVGYTRVKDGATELSGSLARIDLTRYASHGQSLDVSLGTQYSTDGDVFRFAQSNSRKVGGVADINGNGTPFRSNYFFGRYSVDTERTQVAVSGEFSREDYEFESASDPRYMNTLNRKVSGFDLAIERDITEKTFVNLDSGYRITNYDDVDRKDKDLAVELRFGFRFSDAFNVYISGQHLDRESTDGMYSYTENRYLIGIAYIPAWGRSHGEQRGRNTIKSMD